MAGSSLLTLIDDIATLLDDIAAMSKVAAKKTTSVLSDDLALNANQVSGVRAERELPVVWAVAKGSIKNKLILIPAALAISAVIPWAISPLLMFGGAYLCYEGFEKIVHRLQTRTDDNHHAEELKALCEPDIDIVALEKNKIQGAIRTDLILSAEIIVIILGTVKDAPFVTQLGVVSFVAALMTVGVYGIVALIVKLDDIGLYLVKKQSQNALRHFRTAFGHFLINLAPKLMKILSVVGTVAMFMVGGGILVHGIPVGHDVVHSVEVATKNIAGVGDLLNYAVAPLIDVLTGVIAGAIALVVILGISASRKAIQRQ